MAMRLPSHRMKVISGYYRLYNKHIIRSSMGCSSMYLYILMRRVLQLPLPEGSLQQSHDISRGEAMQSFDQQYLRRHHAKKLVIQLEEEIQKINFLNKKREWRTRDPHGPYPNCGTENT
ncbi:hypothetical protein Ahy_A06g029206 [Arachis hypogaea]|uniref:Uncharacterized protein n=1 Tax=Arachis hypogaea TaxID=3818 RepID=A0A445CSS5_ARAHY|nr:hypothetical protein Ahy_A06g029206 [Arachis hypogaea]